MLLLVAALLAAIFASLSNGIAILTGQRETLIGAVSLLLLPLTFLSGALMQLSLAPGWIGTVAKFNPVDWAATAARNATTQDFDWGVVAGASGCSPRSSCSPRGSPRARSPCTSARSEPT